MLWWCLGIFFLLCVISGIAGALFPPAPHVCKCTHFGMHCGCWHNGGMDRDGIWKCRDCQRAWYKSYLDVDWIEADPKMEEYLRDSSEQDRQRFQR